MKKFIFLILLAALSLCSINAQTTLATQASNAKMVVACLDNAEVRGAWAQGYSRSSISYLSGIRIGTKIALKPYTYTKNGGTYRIKGREGRTIKVRANKVGMSNTAFVQFLEDCNSDAFSPENTFTPTSIPFADAEGRLTESPDLTFDADLTSLFVGNVDSFGLGDMLADWADRTNTSLIMRQDGSKGVVFDNGNLGIANRAGGAAFFFDTYSGTGNITWYVSGGTPNAKVAIDSSSLLAVMKVSGYDGTTWSNSNTALTTWEVIATDTFTPSAMGKEQIFYTIPNGTTTGVAALHLTNNGTVALESTIGAFMPNVLTAVQATALTPVNGMMVYVTSTDGTFIAEGFWGYVEGAWTALH